MSLSRRNLTPSQAAAHLGVSVKSLRLYEQKGLITPDRSSSGWRLYSADDLKRAADVVSLRALGLSLAEIGRALRGGSNDLLAGLVANEDRLRQQARRIADALHKTRGLRGSLLRDQEPARCETPRTKIGFALPWPWGGEWFALDAICPLTFITGPLGSGKTRLAETLAATLPDASFIGLDRLTDASVHQSTEGDADLVGRVERILALLEENGAEHTPTLWALVAALESAAHATLVIDLVEQDLSRATQRALIAYLRARSRDRRSLFLMTRSSSILDLETVGADEAVILCPANHSPPFYAALQPGGRGYEAVSTCLATPEVRARATGIVAMRPGVVG